MTKIQENTLLTLDSTQKLIQAGRVLVISGDEQLLKQLPKGNWIGGTIPYFYLKNQQGRMDKKHLFVSDFTDLLENFAIRTYTEADLHTVCTNSFGNGFNFMILPALQNIHFSFAINAPQYPNLYLNPLVGLIAGEDLEAFANGKTPQVFNGQTQEAFTQKAVVLHAQLPAHKVARLEIINTFEPSGNVIIEVEKDGFIVENCFLNGKKVNLFQYLQQNNINIAHPLVSNYEGASINVSFQRFDEQKKQVIFYAPLFKGRKYTFAKPLSEYVKAFELKSKEILPREKEIVYNCNCILNYLHGNLDKNSIGFSGATTFGEIGYQLLNQTFTYLAIDES